jgi:hypothetical protein
MSAALTVEQALDLALGLYRGERWAEAAHVCRLVLEQQPELFEPLFWLGRCLERQGLEEEALAVYEQAVERHPGYGGPFSRRAMLRLRRHWGPPPAPRPPAAGVGRLTNTRLGLDGRWGNQLLQYAFLRMYAAEHGLAVEAPDWIGRDVYGFDDPLPSGGYRVVEESEADLAGALNRRTGASFADADVRGYFCYETRDFARHRGLFQGLFAPAPKAAAVAAPALARVEERGRTVVALHLRRGDFGWGRFWIAPEDWYLDFLRRAWPDLDRPVLYVATDDPPAVARFSEFRPLTAGDVCSPIPGAEFFVDFHVLANAHVLAAANSTFSIVASLLNVRAASFQRPDRALARLVPYDPWNTRVLWD